MVTTTHNRGPGRGLSRLYEISSSGSETFYDNLCSGGLGLLSSCYSFSNFKPDTVELRVVAQACGDASAIDEKRKNIHPPPEDEEPWDIPILDDDASDEPNSCPVPAQTSNPVRLTNGNMRYNERLVLPTSIPELTALTFDTLNPDTGVFGKGWFSAFDARLEVDGGSTSYRYRVITETNHSIYFSDALVQTWPATGPMGELALVNVGGTDYYRHTTPSADLRAFLPRIGRQARPARGSGERDRRHHRLPPLDRDADRRVRRIAAPGRGPSTPTSQTPI